MPLVTDWESFTDGFGPIAIEHFTVNPIVGDRSVRFTIPNFLGSLGESSRAAIMLKEPPHTRGLLLGVIRTLVRVETGTPRRLGIFSMAQSGTNPALAGSECYVLAQGFFNTSPGPAEWHLARVTDLSELAVTLTDLGTTGVPALNIGETLPIELKWKADASIFGGTQLEASFGNLNDLDFSNLTSTLTLTDANDPLLITNGEGLFASNVDEQQEQQVIFDETSVFNTVIV